MKKLSLVLFIYLALNKAAFAYTFGPVEGGKCESCDIWIDNLNANGGGRVNLNWSEGWGDAEADVLQFVNRNCAQRGYQASATMGRMYRTEGIWFPDKARDFTCNMPVTYLEAEYDISGVVSSSENNLYEIQQVADRSCQRKGLSFAKIKERAIKKSSRTIYDFECQQPFQELQSISHQQTATSEDKMTITKAKEECVKLGRKPKTEKFGSCVLELTK